MSPFKAKQLQEDQEESESNSYDEDSAELDEAEADDSTGWSAVFKPLITLLRSSLLQVTHATCKPLR